MVTVKSRRTAIQFIAIKYQYIGGGSTPKIKINVMAGPVVIKEEGET